MRELRTKQSWQPPSELYTASDVARFCEVDLKTIHNWADKGQIPHFRTPGRHLRFRRLDVVEFLKKFGYSVPSALQQVKPRLVLIASDAKSLEALKAGLSPRDRGEEIGLKDFDGHVALEARIVRPVHHAHAALAQLGENLVVRDGTAGHERTRLHIGSHWRGVRCEPALPSRTIQGRIAARLGQQRFDLVPQLTVGVAGSSEERPTRGRLLLQRRVVQILDLLPPLGGHDNRSRKSE